MKRTCANCGEMMWTDEVVDENGYAEYDCFNCGRAEFFDGGDVIIDYEGKKEYRKEEGKIKITKELLRLHDADIYLHNAYKKSHTVFRTPDGHRDSDERVGKIFGREC